MSAIKSKSEEKKGAKEKPVKQLDNAAGGDTKKTKSKKDKKKSKVPEIVISDGKWLIQKLVGIEIKILILI